MRSPPHFHGLRVSVDSEPASAGADTEAVPGMPRKRVYIVDDHRFFVAGLSSLINHDTSMEVCGSAPDGRKVVSEVRRLHPDLVLMDVKLPRTSGLVVARNIRKFLGDIPILFISSLTEPRIREEAGSIGALGFLEKTQEPGRILDGIRRALGL